MNKYKPCQLHVTFRQLNSAFDKEYADTYNFGRETNENMRFHWSNTLGVEKVDNLEIISNSSYYVKMPNENNGFDKVEIPNMTILKCYNREELVTAFAISKELLDKNFGIEKTNKGGKKYYYFTLKDNVIFVNPLSGLYISPDTVPRIIKDK